MRNGKIIIVDDNEAVLKTLRIILSRAFRTVVAVSNPTLLPALLREEDVDVVLLDMNFGTGKQTGGEGLFWLDRIRERGNPPAVVLITAFGDVELAVASLKKGAADFIVKPWDNDKLLATLINAWEQHLRIRTTPVSRADTEEHPVVGQGTFTAQEPLPVSGQEEDSGDRLVIDQLLDYFLRKYATAYGKAFPVLDSEAHLKLTAILRNGNLQLLQQCIERAMLLHHTSHLTAADFYTAEPEPSATPLTLDEMEKQFIQTVLYEKNGNLTLTAQQLNISRQTLYNKMRKYGL